ncbi:MAG: hypothetical protein IKM48_08705 [Clostridia bacterium]|nr:hypothetical protein [Clostridia bacterium]
MAENETMSAAVETGAQTADNAAASQEVVAPAAESVPGGEQQAAEAGAQPASEGVPKARQSKEDNARYKANRIKAEAYDGISDSVLKLARSKGLSPKNAEEALKMLHAEAEGKSFEEYTREEAAAEAALEQQVKGSKAYQDLLKRAEADRADAARFRAEEQMRKDLEAIRRVDPSVESLESLGDEFMEAVRKMDGLSAYYMIKGKQAAMAAAMPPDTGEVGHKSNDERDYTSEELDRLTSKDLDDPNVFQRALRSLANLKK